MTTQSKHDEQQWKTVVDTLGKFMLPFVLVALGWMYSYLDKLEGRIYTLQANSVSEQKLQATEQRIMNYLDTRLGDISNQLQLIIKQNELQRQYDTQQRRQ